MMTTKVVRPPLGRRERGWQGETELLPLLFFLSLPLCRASKREKEGRRERGWLDHDPPFHGECTVVAARELELIAFITQKKEKKEKKKLSISPSLFPLPRIFFNSRNKRARYLHQIS